MTPVPDQGKPLNCGRPHPDLTLLLKELPLNEALCWFDAYWEEFIRHKLAGELLHSSTLPDSGGLGAAQGWFVFMTTR